MTEPDTLDLDTLEPVALEEADDDREVIRPPDDWDDEAHTDEPPTVVP